MTAAATDRQTDAQADRGFFLRFQGVSSVPGSVSREDTHQGEHSTQQTRGLQAGQCYKQSRAGVGARLAGHRGHTGPGEGAVASDSMRTRGKGPGRQPLKGCTTSERQGFLQKNNSPPPLLHRMAKTASPCTSSPSCDLWAEPHSLPLPPGDPSKAGDTGWSLTHGDGGTRELAGLPHEVNPTGWPANQKGGDSSQLNTARMLTDPRTRTTHAG